MGEKKEKSIQNNGTEANLVEAPDWKSGGCRA